MLRLLFLAVCLFTSLAAFAYELECDPESNLVIDAACLLEEETEPLRCKTMASEMQRELERVYEYIWTGSYYRERTLLEASQGAWLEYRQVACDMANRQYEECLERLTAERTALLRALGAANYLYVP